MSDPLLPTPWLGYAAASCTTLSFLPQAALTLRTRNVAGISLGMYGAFTVGVALWLWYGWRLGEWPIIVANAVTLALAATILATKLWVEHGPGGAARRR
jgi:MtN3 and saliva related transmembrane protein